MSTILKALKKLEHDKAAFTTRGSLPVYSTASSPSGGSNQRDRKQRLGKSLLGATTVCLILAVSVYFYLKSSDRGGQVSTKDGEQTVTSSQGRDLVSRPDEKKPPATSVAATNDAKPPVGSPSILPAESMSARGEPSSSPPPEPVIVNASRGTEKSLPLTPIRPAREGLREGQPIEENPVPKSQAEIPRVVEKPDERAKEASAKPSLPTVSAQTRVAATRDYANVPRLTDGRLKVHAITWSPVPKNCLAVINSSIVYEGDYVDGLVVVAIEEKAVILREKEGTMWRVVIGQQ